MQSCCAGRDLSAACQARCNFDSYNQDLLQKMLIGQDECPLASLPEMQFCAAQGRNHSKCCVERVRCFPIRYSKHTFHSLPEIDICMMLRCVFDSTKKLSLQGVNSVAAGDKCLVFCDQIPDKFTPIDYTYASCFGKFDEMKT